MELRNLKIISLKINELKNKIEDSKKDDNN